MKKMHKITSGGVKKKQIVMHRLECQRTRISGRDLVIFLPHETSDISQERLPVGSLILWEGR